MDAGFEGALPVQVRIINPQQIPLLERLPWIHTVQHLNIYGVDPVKNGPSLLVLCDIELPELRSLEIEHEFLSYDHINKLIHASFFRRLQRLSLKNCNLSLPALQLLLRHPPEHLTSLNLSLNNAAPALPIASKLGKIFSSSPVLQKLQQLDLTDCRVGKQDMEAILSLPFPNLKVLSIASNDLTHIGDEFLAQRPWFRRLEALSAGESGIERALLSSILDEAKSLQLKRLKLNGDWSQRDIEALLAHPGFSCLEVVDLGVPYTSEASWMELLNVEKSNDL